jgi:hypothetical protein
MGTVIAMQVTSTGGTESGLAAIDVPKDGALIGVTWACRTFWDTTLDFQDWQLSFGSASSTANDSRQIISEVSLGTMTIGAAGIMVGQANVYDSIPDIQVGMGERIFLHSIAAVAVVGHVVALLHFDFDLDMPKARRR